MIAKCDCQSCGQPMEFDADQFERSGETTNLILGQSVTCPNCGKSAQLYVPSPSSATPPPLKFTTPARSKIPSVFIPNFEWVVRHKLWSIAISLCFSFFTLCGFEGCREDGGGVFISLIYGFGIAVLATGLLAFAIFVYFFPTIVAKQRQKKNDEAIFVLNLLTGWTFVGWVIAVVWAYTKDSTN